MAGRKYKRNSKGQFAGGGGFGTGLGRKVPAGVKAAARDFNSGLVLSSALGGKHPIRDGIYTAAAGHALRSAAGRKAS